MNLADLFSVASLTESINKLPVNPGKVGEMNIFAEKGVSTTLVVIDEKEGRLILVPNTSRNDDGQHAKTGQRNRRIFETSHLPLSDVILPVDLQNIAGFGSDNVESNQAKIINDRLEALKKSIEATREWHRIGALRGKILDANGNVLIDLFKEFDVTQKILNIDFSTATTDVRKSCLDAKRHAESKLSGVRLDGFRALCDPAFFDALTSHPSVEKAYANYQEAQDRIGGDMRKGFRHGDIEFVEYDVTISGQKFIPEGTAQVFPLGDGVFFMNNAPANYNEAVNSVGLPYYSKAEERKMGKGWNLEVQANPLALCMFPAALVQLTTS